MLEAVDDGVLAGGGADRLALASPVPLEIDGASAFARFTVRDGHRLGFALQHRTSSQPPPLPWTQQEIDDRVADTAHAWRTWSALHQAYDGPWRDLVHHSGRVLYTLTYFPTGAMCAAPTTSLPESPGGSRNWDYRYAWVRDASFTLQALWVAACPDEADKFFDYIACAAATQVHDGARPADHVRHRRRARSHRTGAPAPLRLARLHARSRRQRRVEPTADRRVRRAPGRCRPTSRPGGAARAREPRLPRRPRRRRRDAMARPRPGHLGDPRPRRATSSTRS